MNFCRRFIGAFGLGLVAFVASITALYSGVNVYADEIPEYRLQISPATLDLDLKPGEKYTTTFKVQNTGQKDFDFEVSASPYSVTNENYDMDFLTETQYTDIADWVSFSMTEGELKPGDSKEITATINVPKDVPAGGQYGIILARIMDDRSDSGTGVAITKQVGIVLYSNVEGKTRVEGKIEENKVPSFMFNPPITATSVIENTGNTHIEAEYVLQVFPFFGGEEIFTNEENPVKRKILPETRRYNEMSWDGAPKLGLFKVKQTIKAFGETSVTEKVVFICPIWFLFIIVLILFCVVFWIVSRIRGRNKD